MERELVEVINHVEPCLLVVEAGFASVVEALRSQVPSVKGIVSFGGRRPGMEDYEALIACSSAAAPAVSVELEDLACLIHTSGTTGTPKEVMWTHRNWLAGVLDIVTEMRVAHRDIGLHVVPAFHITFAWPMLAYLYWGCTQVVMRRFDSGAVLDTVEKERITSTFRVPTMIISLLEEPDLGTRDLSSLHLVMYGGSPMPVPVLERVIRAFGPVFMPVYGLSEQSGALHQAASGGAHLAWNGGGEASPGLHAARRS